MKKLEQQITTVYRPTLIVMDDRRGPPALPFPLVRRKLAPNREVVLRLITRRPLS